MKELAKVSGGWSKRLSEALRLSGLTKSEVAYLARLDRASLSRFLSGKRQPTPRQRILLARALDLQVAKLFPVTEELGGRTGLAVRNKRKNQTPRIMRQTPV